MTLEELAAIALDADVYGPAPAGVRHGLSTEQVRAAVAELMADPDGRDAYLRARVAREFDALPLAIIAVLERITAIAPHSESTSELAEAYRVLAGTRLAQEAADRAEQAAAPADRGPRPPSTSGKPH